MNTHENIAPKWRNILAIAGAPLHLLHEKWQPCPACGGLDRFRLNLSTGDFICNRCTPSGGNAYQFLKMVEAQDTHQRINQAITILAEMEQTHSPTLTNTAAVAN